MKRLTLISLLFFLILNMFASMVFSVDEPETNTLQYADNVLFKDARFEEAEEIYKKINKQDPQNYQAFLGHSRVAVMKNHLGCAFRYSKTASELKPEEKEPYYNMAIAYFRMHRYGKAKPMFEKAGFDDLAQLTGKFKDLEPYKVDDLKKEYRIDLIEIEPAPIIKIKVNGSGQQKFLIDPGACMIMLDKKWCDQNDIEYFGKIKKSYGPEMNCNISLGKLESVELGNLEVKNVPIEITDISEFDLAGLEQEITGIIGLDFLMMFITEINYKQKQLILTTVETREEYQGYLKNIEKEKIQQTPFYIDPRNNIIIPGRTDVNSEKTFLVNPGYPGLGLGINSVQYREGNFIKENNSNNEITVFSTVAIELGEISLNNFQGRIEPEFDYIPIYPYDVDGVLGGDVFRFVDSMIFDFIGMNIIVVNKTAGSE